MVPLGAKVLTLACQQAQHWQPHGIPARDLTVAVNLSSRQFGYGDLSSVVKWTLERTGLDPSCLHLELTETAIMDLHPDILRQLERIRDLGVEMGLDDFGTGYASLTHLRRLPLSFVKIDQSFVQGLGTDAEDERIVAAVIDLAANLGLRSIAEGVETPGQRDRLRDLGCDQAQGYLFGRAMPPEQVPWRSGVDRSDEAAPPQPAATGGHGRARARADLPAARGRPADRRRRPADPARRRRRAPGPARRHRRQAGR